MSSKFSVLALPLSLVPERVLSLAWLPSDDPGDLGNPLGGISKERGIFNRGDASRNRPLGRVMALLLALLVISSDVSAAPRFPYPWPDYSVIPVLFSPTDWDINSPEVQEEAAALRLALREVQEFYGRALGEKTFVLNELEVVQGHHPKGELRNRMERRQHL